MRTHKSLKGKTLIILLLAFIAVIVQANLSFASEPSSEQQDKTAKYVEFKGKVVDSETNDPLTFATLSIEGTNIATVCNSEGFFSLKVPENMLDKNVEISFLGYKDRSLAISELEPENNNIELQMLTVSIGEVSVFPRDPDMLMRAVMNKRKDNYMDEHALMTAFYRETIKKGRKYVSLSEAVLNVYKQPYMSGKADQISLFKGRKTTDYTRLDTLVFKLQGGPYTTLLLDVVKNPYLIFTDDMFGKYEFNLVNITRIDERIIYVMDFKQLSHIKDPLFYGKLYIDAESLAITSVSFNLNITNKDEAAAMFIKRKPAGARVYPTEAGYLVNYREKDGKWYFGYSRGQITFKVNWKRKVFNSTYASTVELAITDWDLANIKPFTTSDRMKTNIIMSEDISGFADKEFWGEHNYIEPEKSIESAIKKIQKKLE